VTLEAQVNPEVLRLIVFELGPARSKHACH